VDTSLVGQPQVTWHVQRVLVELRVVVVVVLLVPVAQKVRVSPVSKGKEKRFSLIVNSTVVHRNAMSLSSHD
jgi:hypothetical protein